MKTNVATLLGGLLFFIQYVPYFYLQSCYDSLSWPEKAVVCLLCNVALAFGTHVIGDFESSGMDLTWSSINETTSADDSFSLLHVLCILWLDALFCIVFALYIDVVFPGEYGVPKQWNFLFQRFFRKKTNAVKMRLEMESDEIENQEWVKQQESIPLMTESEEPFEMPLKENFEAEPSHLFSGIRLIHITKEFYIGSEKKQVVCDLILNMYEGHVTVLLGHNGAGKTTAFSILTGLFPPTNGTAFVAGFDITENMEDIHQILGVCPQMNVLFDMLTVEEHLIFFNKLKGSFGRNENDKVKQMMSDIGLVDKRNAFVKTLSGGMKRKLSVGIAFIGRSKVVILDEPTSGMDPYARRKTWELIRRHLPGRTILVSTHCMEEAEAVGDRIAIMVNGVIKCCGCSMFLKRLFGNYHRLTMNGHANCDVQKVTEFLQGYIPEIEVVRSCGNSTLYLLPNSKREKFHELFAGIERKKEDLGIALFGVSSASLEEVFLKINHSLLDQETEMNSLPDEGITSDKLLFGENLSSPYFCAFSGKLIRAWLNCIFALLQKKALHSLHSHYLMFFQFLIPLVFMAVPLAFLRGLFHLQDSLPLALDVKVFSSPSVAYWMTSKSDQELMHFYSAYASVFDSDVRLINVSDDAQQKKPCRRLRKFLTGEGKKSLRNYNTHFPISLCLTRLNPKTSSIQATVFFNDEVLHTAPISLNALDNAILRYATNTTKKWKIRVVNHPLPRTYEESLGDLALQGLEGYVVAYSLLFGMSFLVGSFALFLIHERMVGAKRCQLLGGSSVWSFWWSTFCWDWSVLSWSCGLVVVCFWVFHLESFTYDRRWLLILLLFTVYGWAMLPGVYLASFLFIESSSGFLWITVFNILFVILGSFVEFLESLKLDAFNFVATVDLFLHMLPNYCLFKSLSKMHVTYNYQYFCKRDEIKMSCSLHLDHPCCPESCKHNCFEYTNNLLSWKSRSGIGKELLLLGIWGAVYFTILLLVEKGLFRRLSQCFRLKWSVITLHLCSCYTADADSEHQENDDVAAERKRISEMKLDLLTATEPVVVRDLFKRFGSTVAVDSLSIGIGRGECFGLLGVNGAGKTTVFRMLVGDEIIAEGNACICGQDVKKSIPKIGYCPQSDALIDELTGRELLILYAFLRNVDSALVHSYVQELLDCLLLLSDADKLTKVYSGGTKRKLNAAIALIGWPSVILLDEPSTGMDPIARRRLWNVLLKLRELGRTILLSTHSMDECETLCNRIGILVNGRLQCLGNSQHLKSRFGKEFRVSVRIRASPRHDFEEERAETIEEYIAATLSSEFTFKNENGIFIVCVDAKSSSLSHLFKVMEDVKRKFPVEDYSVTQAALEEIFINFAQAQTFPEQASFCKRLCRCKHS